MKTLGYILLLVACRTLAAAESDAVSLRNPSITIEVPREVGESLRSTTIPFFRKLESYARHLNVQTSSDPALLDAIMQDEATRLGLQLATMQQLALALQKVSNKLTSTYSNLLNDTCVVFANTMPNSQARDLIRAYDAMKNFVNTKPAAELLADIETDFGKTTAVAVRARIDEWGASMNSSNVKIEDTVERGRGGDYLSLLAEICPTKPGA